MTATSSTAENKPTLILLCFTVASEILQEPGRSESNFVRNLQSILSQREERVQQCIWGSYNSCFMTGSGFWGSLDTGGVTVVMRQFFSSAC